MGPEVSRNQSMTMIYFLLGLAAYYNRNTLDISHVTHKETEVINCKLYVRSQKTFTDHARPPLRNKRVESCFLQSG